MIQVATEIDLATEQGRETARAMGLPIKDDPRTVAGSASQPSGAHYCLALDGHTSRLNDIMAGVKASISLKKRDKLLVLASSQGLPKAVGKRRVAITVIVSKGRKRADRDAYWKSLLDALVHCGMLINDSPDWCETGTVEYARGERSRMFVELWEM